MKQFIVMLLACMAIASALPTPGTRARLNNPPNAPDSIQGVDGGALNQYIRFTTTSTDPDGDSIYVEFVYDTTQPNRNSGWLGPVAGGTLVSDSTMYDSAGTYYVVAYAKDTAGAVSAPSPVKAITIVPLEIAWQFQTVDGDAFYSSPAINTGAGDTLVYCGCDDAQIYEFNARTGAAISSFTSFNEDAFSSSPAISTGGQRVYIADDGGWLYCLNAAGLGEISSYPAGDTWVPGMQPFFSTPAVCGNRIYIGRDDGYFYCFDDDAGQLVYRFSYNTTQDISCSPAIDSDGARIVVGNDSGYVFCFNDTLGVMWARLLPAPTSSSPAIKGDTVYIGCDDQNLYALNLTDGSIIGTPFQASDFISSSPVIDAAGNVYFDDDVGTVYRVNSDTLVWSEVLPYGENTSATCCLAPDTSLIINTDDGSAYSLDLGTGAVRWRIEWPEPILAKHGRNAIRGRGKTAALSSSVTIGPGNGTLYAGSPNEGFFAVKVNMPSFQNGSLPAAPWPKFHHDIANSGWSARSGIQMVDVVWQFQTVDGDPFNSSPAIGYATGDTIVYCGDDYDQFHAFNARTGASEGSFTALNEDAFSSSPVISADGQRVYIADDGGWFYCLRASNLTDISHYPPSDTWQHGMQPFFSTPAVYGNKIYIGRDDGYLYYFGDSAGQLTYRFSYNASQDISSSPAISSDGTRIVVGNDSGYVYCFDDTLGMLWRRYLGAWNNSSPAIGGDTVYIGCEDDSLYALSLTNGSIIGIPFCASDFITSSPVIDASGNVYFDVESGTVYCVKNGAEVWHRILPYGENTTATCCLAPDTSLIINTNNGSAYGLDLVTGAVRWRIQWPTPILAKHGHKSASLSSSATMGPGNGIFFAGSPIEGFFAAEVNRRSFRNGSLPNTPWPKFHHDLANSGWTGWLGTGIAEKTTPSDRLGAHAALECPSLFLRQATIKYYLTSPGRAVLKVYSATGALVRNLSVGPVASGVHLVVWDGCDNLGKSLRPGVYYCRVMAGGRAATRKLVKVN